MKKYIKICIILIIAFAAAFPLFNLLPKSKIFYMLFNAIAMGIINYKAVAYIMELAARCNYPDLDELKTDIYAGNFRPDPLTPKVLTEEIRLYGILKKITYLDVAVVLVVVAFLMPL